MITRGMFGGTLLCLALLAVGCGPPSSSTDKPSAAPTSSAPEPAQVQATDPAPPEEAQVTDASSATDVAPEAPVPAPEALVASPAPLPAAAPAATATAKPPAEAPAKSPATPPAASLAAATSTTTPKAAAPAPVATAAPAPAAAPSPAPAPAATTSSIADPGGTVAVAATKPGLTRIGAEACGDCHDVQFESWAGGAHAKRNPPLDCEHCHGPGSEYKSKAVMKDPAKAEAAGLVMPDKAFCAKCHKKGVDDAFMEKAHAHDE